MRILLLVKVLAERQCCKLLGCYWAATQSASQDTPQRQGHLLLCDHAIEFRGVMEKWLEVTAAYERWRCSIRRVCDQDYRSLSAW